MGLPKGKTNNPNGRPAGSKNKTAYSMASIKYEFLETFEKLQKDEKANLFTWAKENTSQFYNLASKFFPYIIEANITSSCIPINQWTDNKPINIDDIQLTDGTDTE